VRAVTLTSCSPPWAASTPQLHAYTAYLHDHKVSPYTPWHRAMDNMSGGLESPPKQKKCFDTRRRPNEPVRSYAERSRMRSRSPVRASRRRSYSRSRSRTPPRRSRRRSYSRSLSPVPRRSAGDRLRE
jgi:hypothetical protein